MLLAKKDTQDFHVSHCEIKFELKRNLVLTAPTRYPNFVFEADRIAWQIMEHFLLIEDDIDDQEIFCMAVQAIDSSIKCSIAGNGYDAVHLLKSESSFTPDHIFLDVNMPRMNGLECLKEIRQMDRLRNTRIIMYSTSDDQKMMILCKNLGADAFIIKPPSFESLKRILFSLISEKKSAHDRS